jgi:hypothetical protein
MYQSGKAAQIAKEMHKYKIEVMRLDGFQQERRSLSLSSASLVGA